MRCLNEVRDELHDYTAEICGRLMELKPLHEIVSDNFNCAVVHRSGLFQTELCRIQPGHRIPLHRHPGVDSIDVSIAGRGLFTVGGIEVPSIKRYAVRIGQDVWHGGQNGNDLFIFASCQRWNREPSHIVLTWEGPACTPAHERLFKTMKDIV